MAWYQLSNEASQHPSKSPSQMEVAWTQCQCVCKSSSNDRWKQFFFHFVSSLKTKLKMLLSEINKYFFFVSLASSFRFVFLYILCFFFSSTSDFGQLYMSVNAGIISESEWRRNESIPLHSSAVTFSLWPLNKGATEYLPLLQFLLRWWTRIKIFFHLQTGDSLVPSGTTKYKQKAPWILNLQKGIQ